MQKINIPQVESQSADLIQENIEQLKQIFPEIIKEGRIDVEVLNDLLGNYIDTPEERFYLNWAGKANARREAQKRSTGTLRPCPEESVNWDTTENLYIEGDNLEVLKLLQKSYHSKVKMIYIDPPYNTGKDFVYKDNYTDNMKNYLELTDQDTKLSTNTESDGRFHSSWLNMMYPRLKLARNLLSDTGVILVSIGDNELSNLIKILDEIFGENNRVCMFTWRSRAKPTNAGNAKFRPQKTSEYILVYSKIGSDDLLFNSIASKTRAYPHKDKLGNFRTTTILTSNRGTFRRETMRFESNGFQPDDDYRWKAGKVTIDGLFSTGHILMNEDGIPMEKKYEHEESDPLYPIYCYMDTELTGTAESGKIDLSDLVGNKHGFDTVKPVQLIKYLVATFSDQDSIILDFFSGTATTAQAVEEQNIEDNGDRKYILIQFPEEIDENSEAYQANFRTVCDIAYRRLHSFKKIHSENKDIGFKVFKLDSSNINAWDSDPDNLETALNNSLFNIKEDRSEDDLLFEILIKYGLELTEMINRNTIDGKTVYEMGAGSLIVCLADNLTTEVAEGIGKLFNKVKPEGVEGNCRVVFKDSGFNGSDEVKTNTLLILKQHGITNIASV